MALNSSRRISEMSTFWDLPYKKRQGKLPANKNNYRVSENNVTSNVDPRSRIRQVWFYNLQVGRFRISVKRRVTLHSLQNRISFGRTAPRQKLFVSFVFTLPTVMVGSSVVRIKSASFFLVMGCPEKKKLTCHNPKLRALSHYSLEGRP